MKKAIFAALAALPLVLAGCSDSSGGDDNSTTVNTGTDAEATTRTLQGDQVIEKVVADRLEVTAQSGSEYILKPGSRVGFLDATFQNSILRICEDVEISDGFVTFQDSTIYTPTGSDYSHISTTSAATQDIEYTPPCGY